MIPATEAVQSLPGLPRDEDGPTFSEGWQADVFATTLALIEAGRFGWDEWTAALSNAIAAAQHAGDPDLGDTYYDHWLAALETLCTTRGQLTHAEVDQRQLDWRRAYENTPHGQPVELSAAPPTP